MATFPYMLYANSEGELYDCPELQMSVSSGGYDFLPYMAELIPLPEGSTLHYIKNSSAVGFNIHEGKFETYSDKLAVHAKLPDEYLRLFLPSYKCDDIPEYIYAPVGWDSEKETIVTCGLQMALKRESDGETIAMMSTKHIRKYPNNKIIGEFHKQILNNPEKMSYNFYPSAHERLIPINIITKESDIDELLELALSSDEKNNKKIVSLASSNTSEDTDDIDYSKIFTLIKSIKGKYSLVTIVYDTNLNNKIMLEKLIISEIDSINVNINSIDDFTDDVIESLKIAKNSGVHIILTLHTVPGINDKKDDVDRLIEIINDYNIGMLLTKNKYRNNRSNKSSNKEMQELISLKNMLKEIYKKCKNTQLGAFLRAKSDYNTKLKLPKLK